MKIKFILLALGLMFILTACKGNINTGPNPNEPITHTTQQTTDTTSQSNTQTTTTSTSMLSM